MHKQVCTLLVCVYRERDRGERDLRERETENMNVYALNFVCTALKSQFFGIIF